MTRSMCSPAKTQNMKENSPDDGHITGFDAIKLNRRERRQLGKANKAKIFGSRTDHLKTPPHALTTFTGRKI